jgi:hypothetical protein
MHQTCRGSRKPPGASQNLRAYGRPSNDSCPTCNSSFVAEVDVRMRPKTLGSRLGSIRKQESECGSFPPREFEDRVSEPLSSRILDSSTPGDHGMKHFLALAIFLCALASSNAAAPLYRIRIAQARGPAECVSNCNSANFSCAQNCGLSGSCVARCTAEAATCKARCDDLK